MTNQTNNEKSKNGKRLALILVALLLIAAVAFGAFTYSRYISEINGTGSATVAKWGFTANISAEDMGFSKMYKTDGTATTEAAEAVISSKNTVVAPGAKGSVTFSVSGKAEVDAQLSVAIAEAGLKDIYITLTNSSEDSTTTLEYHPVLFTLMAKSDSGDTYDKPVTANEVTLTDVTLKQMQAALAADQSTFNQTLEAAAEDPINMSYELSWAWQYEVTEAISLYNTDGTKNASYTFDAESINKLDTLLGQLSYNANGDNTDVTIPATKVQAEEGSSWTVSTSTYSVDYSVELNFVLTISVAQVEITQE